ncbi:unnamed protein product (macronuclear) [Paramecium tetraurelia]|uniref:Uncharacterized protein n=1 Tax=Paramecium tetraurelia TaxID=5888 RepID=A0DTC4_PARTE|nr:uncharacterized protein GSPATT00019984001 [Paramecium tetraurelia]CAK86291.1 unnamed protein product [Paramecium tetraurelia]|eukprot:XP_001453688.1 hypothetical protein (macronuclear) [Paramecium tetraurelia strain d4-2]
MKRSFSHPIKRITTFYKSARLRSESWIPSPIRVSITQFPILRSSLQFPNQNHQQYCHNHIDNCNDLMKNELHSKIEEIDNLKKKIIISLETIEKQDEIIQEWQQKYQEQEKLHNREIAQLKSNLDNSIFDDPQIDIIEQPIDNSHHKVVDDLQIIQEESECPQIKSLNQSVAQNLKFYEIINALNKFNLDESPVREQLEINESYVVQRINTLIDFIHKLETELDDWKCNYWNLEKKLNSQLKDNFIQQGSREIEIEFDFDKNQLVKAIQSNSRRSLQAETSALQLEIKRLQELNSQLQYQQKSQAKQVLESLINKQKKTNRKKNLTHIPEPSNKHLAQVSIPHKNSHNNTQKKSHPTQQGSPYQQRNNQQINQYFSHYFQQQRVQPTQHYSPIILTKFQQIATKQQIGINYLKDTSTDHYYNVNIHQTPIVVKQSSLSPYQKSGSKFIQF